MRVIPKRALLNPAKAEEILKWQITKYSLELKLPCHLFQAAHWKLWQQNIEAHIDEEGGTAWNRWQGSLKSSEYFAICHFKINIYWDWVMKIGAISTCLLPAINIPGFTSSNVCEFLFLEEPKSNWRRVWDEGEVLSKDLFCPFIFFSFCKSWYFPNVVNIFCVVHPSCMRNQNGTRFSSSSTLITCLMFRNLPHTDISGWDTIPSLTEKCDLHHFPQWWWNVQNIQSYISTLLCPWTRTLWCEFQWFLCKRRRHIMTALSTLCINPFLSGNWLQSQTFPQPSKEPGICHQFNCCW